MDTFVRQYKTFDVNVMVGVGDGLVAPVVRNVGGRGLKAISDEVRALATSAQAMELEPHQVCVCVYVCFFYSFVFALFCDTLALVLLHTPHAKACFCWCYDWCQVSDFVAGASEVVVGTLLLYS